MRWLRATASWWLNKRALESLGAWSRCCAEIHLKLRICGVNYSLWFWPLFLTSWPPCCFDLFCFWPLLFFTFFVFDLFSFWPSFYFGLAVWHFEFPQSKTNRSRGQTLTWIWNKILKMSIPYRRFSVKGLSMLRWEKSATCVMHPLTQVIWRNI